MALKINSKLQREWDIRLKESGFQDIESKKGTLTRGAPRITDKSPLQIQVIDSYYSMASYFFNEHNFDSELEKTIWNYHAEGLNSREISIVLRSAGIKEGSHYVTIWKIIKRLEKEMKAKYLAP